MQALTLSPRTLRVRLLLAFSALVSLVLFVGLASYAIHRRARTRVAELRSSDMIDLRKVDLANVGLEFEGSWNPRGSFVASDVEVLPGGARPRLRGVIQALDPKARTLTLYGRVIHVTDDTEAGDHDDEPLAFEALVVGRRAEVTCKVKDDRWEASKVYLEKVKSSDKVKGTVTASELDGVAPESVEIHGLAIVLQPTTTGGSESALGRIERATHLILALETCSSAAGDLVSRARSALEGSEEGGPPDERLRVAAATFTDLLEEAQAEGHGSLSSAPQDYLRTLAPLVKELDSFQRQVRELAELARTDANAAFARVEGAFEPFLRKKCLPVAYAYLSQAEEELGDELRGVLEQAETTTSVALATSVVAAIVAAVLGFLVWRSIHIPLHHLREAAQRFGQGHLDTRIRLDGHPDEFVSLAGAFNKMAEDPTTTTVSMESLESVFDSMAAALIVFDPEGNIVNVNRATLALVGRERSELIGQTFDVMCRFSAGESPRPGPAAREPSGLQTIRIESVEKVFVRKDGSEFPVSFSGAELRPRGGPLQGYVCVALDLTEQKRIQARLSESLGEKELLLREVHHRVKNNMQVISSLLAMQSTGGDPEVAKKLEESQNRIRSIALIHEQLYRSTELAHIDVRGYLETLTSQLLQSFGKAGSVRVELEADPLSLDIDQSMALGLIVNELMTNALKYAYPGERSGTLRIRLSEQPDGQRLLTVSDDGPGLTDSRRDGPPTLGMSLIATLARQLRGRVETDGSRGTTVRVIFGRRGAEAVSA